MYTAQPSALRAPVAAPASDERTAIAPSPSSAEPSALKPAEPTPVPTAPFPAACATHQLVRGHCVHVDDL